MSKKELKTSDEGVSNKAIRRPLKNAGGSDRRLTPRQERFVKLFVASDGLMTKRDIAEEAGYSPGAAPQIAFKLTHPDHCPHVVRYIQELAEEVAEKNRVTMDRHVAQLARIRELSLEDKKYASSVAAEKARGAAAGLYVSKSEVMHGGTISIDAMTREDVEQELVRIRKLYDRDEAIYITAEVNEAGSVEPEPVSVEEEA